MILIFVQMLGKMQDRWSITGVWEKLEKQKKVITEPRGGGKGDFDELLQAYYNAIKSSEKSGELFLFLLIPQGAFQFTHCCIFVVYTSQKNHITHILAYKTRCHRESETQIV